MYGLTRSIEVGAVIEQVPIPVGTKECSFDVERELIWVGGGAKFTPVECNLRGFVERGHPLVLALDDQRSYGAIGLAIELGHRGGEETPSGEHRSIKIRDELLTKSIEADDALANTEPGSDDLSHVSLARFSDSGELKFYFRAEMGEETAFAHAEVLGQLTNRETLEAVRRCNVGGDAEDRASGLGSVRTGCAGHVPCLARTIVLFLPRGEQEGRTRRKGVPMLSVGIT